MWQRIRPLFLTGSVLGLFEAGLAASGQDGPLQYLWHIDLISKLRIQRALKHSLKPYQLEPADSFTSVERLEEKVKDAIRLTPVGVRVLCADSGCGKSCIIKQTIINMLDSTAEKSRAHVEGAIEVDCSKLCVDDLRGTGFVREVVHNLGLHCPSSAVSLSDVLPKPRPRSTWWEQVTSSDIYLQRPYGRTVVFLDQFDHLYNSAKTAPNSVQALAMLESFIVSLAEDASRNNSYVVMVAMKNFQVAETMPGWNDHEKISLVEKDKNLFRWKDEELLLVLRKHRLLGLIYELNDSEERELIAKADGRVSTLLHYMQPLRIEK
jgi:hypothetical protein